MRRMKMNCDLCDRESEFVVMAVHNIDGELLDYADYCRPHALKLALGKLRHSIKIPMEPLYPSMHHCYIDGDGTR